MNPSDAKEETPNQAAPAPVKRAYEKPMVTDLGDVLELTRGASGSHVDGNKFTKRN